MLSLLKKKSIWIFWTDFAHPGGVGEILQNGHFGPKKWGATKGVGNREYTCKVNNNIMDSYYDNVSRKEKKLDPVRARGTSKSGPKIRCLRLKNSLFLPNPHFYHLCLLYATKTTFFLWDKTFYIVLRYPQNYF